MHGGTRVEDADRLNQPVAAIRAEGFRGEATDQIWSGPTSNGTGTCETIGGGQAKSSVRIRG